MPLDPLVDFVQNHFSDFRGLPDPRQQTGLNQPQPVDDPEVSVAAARSPMPDWIVPDDLIFPNEPVTWKIDGPISAPQPPPGFSNWGVDVLAFYLPFHFYQNNWGIYLLASGIVYVACVLKGGTLIPGDESLLKHAEILLQEHERFHFEAEVACSRAEIVAKRSLYSVYFAHAFGTPHEEALANARAFVRAVGSQSSVLKSRASSWMKNQGVGYRDFDKWTKPLSFHRGTLTAAKFMTEPQPPTGSLVGPADFLFHDIRRYSVAPFVVNDLKHGSVGLLRPFPKDFGLQVFTHSNDHPPPHVHVQHPPGSRDVRYRWPELMPLKGETPLAKSGQKALHEYVDVYGKEIERRIREIYPKK